MKKNPGRRERRMLARRNRRADGRIKSAQNEMKMKKAARSGSK